MRMSCNGCRVLRKGCSDDCAIRPCVQWINSPESQANATLFLAKFYGRAGLMNLINAGPEQQRPAIFRSLLYEACGRMVNPIYGSVGLLWSGKFQLCQSAVESVLNGSPVMPITSEAAAESQGPPLKLCDIRHVSKDENSVENRGKSRSRVKRSGAAAKAKAKEAAKGQHPSESNVSDLSVSQEQVNESKESASIVSVETTEEACFRFRAEQDTTTVEAGAAGDNNRSCCEGEMKLDLTLGIVHTRDQHLVPVKKRKYEAFVLSSAADENREGKIVPGMDCSSGDSVRT